MGPSRRRRRVLCLARRRDCLTSVGGRSTQVCCDGHNGHTCTKSQPRTGHTRTNHEKTRSHTCTAPLKRCTKQEAPPEDKRPTRYRNSLTPTYLPTNAPARADRPPPAARRWPRLFTPPIKEIRDQRPPFLGPVCVSRTGGSVPSFLPVAVDGPSGECGVT